MDKKHAWYALDVILFLIIFYALFLNAPRGFPIGETITIEKGSSLSSVSALLKQEDIIRSKAAFEFFVILFGKEKKILSADYSFERRLPVFEIARRIGGGLHHTAPVSVTIPEGFDLNQIGDTFALKLPGFHKDEFLRKTEGLEGYLFPDTYFFLRNATDDIVIESMRNNYQKKTAPLLPEISASGKKEYDIIIMASIIEREAKGDNDRELISGILWKRIKIGMPLQADAAPDTYKLKGLPKAPIANPGLKSIEASIHPQSSPYLYYLHDKEGNIHYAKTFNEHTQNVSQYLK